VDFCPICLLQGGLSDRYGGGGGGGGRGGRPLPTFSGGGGGSGSLRLGDAATWATHTVSAPLLKALLCAALYPQVMTLEYPKAKKGKEVKAEALKFKIREEGSPEPVRSFPCLFVLLARPATRRGSVVVWFPLFVGEVNQ